MIKLYHVPRSRSVRVAWLLEELHVPYELVTMTFAGLKTPEYLRIHPLGKVPAIQDGNLTMFESGAIVEFLLEKYGNGRLAPPPGTDDRGRFLQWMHYGEATLLPPLGEIAAHTFFRPEAERIAAVVIDARGRLETALAVVDRALAGREYLVGDSFTVADLMVGYSLGLTNLFGLLGDQFAHLAGYLRRIEERPAYRKATA